MRRTAAPVLVLLGALALSGCGDDAPDAVAAPVASAPASPAASQPLVVTVAENDGKDARSAVATIGQLVYVDLATCGGCGYEWTVDSAPAAAVATREETAQPTPAAAPSGPPLVGAPTTTRIAFRAVGGGSTPVTIGYHGPGSTKADRSVVVTLTVKQQKGRAGASAG